MDREEIEAQDEAEEDPVCEWCHGTGIAEEQTDVDNFVDVDCNCPIGRALGDVY
jgi:hypothetical protein